MIKMTLTEIKKQLYKQKPAAVKTAYVGEYKHYVTHLNDLNNKVVVQFHIPNKEAEFESKVPAQLLIRWIVE